MHKRRVVLFIVLAFGLSYAGDWLFWHYRVSAHRNPFGTTLVQRYYAIAEKNNRTEFISADPENVECVQALYPHAGEAPCWYARHKKEERIDE